MTEPRWDARQRAMLGALGLNWWPTLREGRESPRPMAAPTPATQPVATERPQPAPVAAPRLVPARDVLPARPVQEPQPLTHPTPDPALPVPELAGLDAEGLKAAIHACRACGLCERRRQAVPGAGVQGARWLIVGEGPGEQEDLQGQPFVGPSGQLLDAILAALNLSRAPEAGQDGVYIANAVKCRPPGNRTPTPEELAACRPYLLRQIELLQPRIIVALGRVAVQSLLGQEGALGSLRGRVHPGPLGVPVVVSYHPSYLLRNPAEKAKAWADWCRAADTLDALSGKSANGDE
ncbi:uracil-DNA glycosylase [Inhella gelatinilytica]|uniref:Type-4 uracil-DNA glycosylase n=1 Tax=Inhella gelatinilytica TaxID=2795030 RepID=A0A931IT36_9BURK|nr:uracil-DNA glycosylase [Inhella gelatinilytica]MBH9552232.1 uracil-DNA glycosylase [Inhella gelatinilytica]